MKQASQAVDYRIVVEGVLDPAWFERLGGLAITEQRQPEQPVVTRLEGRLPDQSALQGVLDTLFMLGLRLLKVECLQSAPEWFSAQGEEKVDGSRGDATEPGSRPG
jgi:hypothetical protein